MKHIDIINRAKREALEYCPDLPKSNSYDAWEDFAEQIEALRDSAYEIASECADSWDWVIYYGKAMKVCLAVDSATLHEAESQAWECSAGELDESDFGLYEMAGKIAYFICQDAIREAIETLCDEREELAENGMQNA